MAADIIKIIGLNAGSEREFCESKRPHKPVEVLLK